jgi:hypothetical protein
MAHMSEPLTDDEYQHVGNVLERFGSERAMNLEMLDGFFAALVSGPTLVPPSEYLPEIWGGAMTDDEAFGGEGELQKFMELVMRRWNTWCMRSIQKTSMCPCYSKMTTALLAATTGRTASRAAWGYGGKSGQSSSMTKIMPAHSCRFWRWRTSITRIQR